MKRYFAMSALIAFSTVASDASATWFAKTDSGGKLLVTGIAENPDGTLATVYIGCEGKILNVEVLTEMNASATDITDYNGTKVIFGYKIKGGEAKKFGVDGEPLVSAGEVVSIKVKLSEEQSQAIFDSIGLGKRLDVELVHPELSYDTGVKKVMADGFTTAVQAMWRACPEFK